MVRVFPAFTHVNEHILLALGSDHTGRDDFKISRSRGQSAQVYLCEPRKTQRSANAVQHAGSLFFDVGYLLLVVIYIMAAN